MEPYKLAEVALIQLKEQKSGLNSATFIIEPLSPGFGLTVGNALRRVLLSSLPGVAITSIRIEGVQHEFSTIKGVIEDVVDIILNLKRVRFDSSDDEPTTIILDVKGARKVTAADFKCPTGVKVINADQHIAELVNGGRLLLEATVERGRGFVSTEARKEEKLPIGVIAIDATFSPIRKVNFQIEHTRVGKMTNFDRLVIDVETDGSIKPRKTLEQSASILVDHFSILSATGHLAGSQAEETAVGSDDTKIKSRPVAKTKTVKKSPAAAKSKK